MELRRVCSADRTGAPDEVDQWAACIDLEAIYASDVTVAACCDYRAPNSDGRRNGTMLESMSMVRNIYDGNDDIVQPTRRRFVWELDWNLLRTFTVIVQEKSLTAAGEKLLLQQSTISNALRRLETHMGRQLIIRHAASFAVTPAGQQLYAECVAMFDIASNLQSLMAERPDQLTGHIELVFTSHVVSPFLDQCLSTFRTMHPKVTFTISVAPSEEVTRMVVQKSTWLGVCLSQTRHPSLEYRTLFREWFGYFCGPTHRLFGQVGIPIEELKAEPYVSFKTDRMSDALWPVALLRQQQGFHGPVAGTSSHFNEVKRLIIAGLGFGPLPIHAIEDDIANGLLWRLPPYQDPPAVDVQVIFDPKARHSKPEQAFLDLLLAEMDAYSLEERSYPRPV